MEGEYQLLKWMYLHQRNGDIFRMWNATMRNIIDGGNCPKSRSMYRINCDIDSGCVQLRRRFIFAHLFMVKWCIDASDYSVRGDLHGNGDRMLHDAHHGIKNIQLLKSLHVL
jgi:hypothetical protein